MHFFIKPEAFKLFIVILVPVIVLLLPPEWIIQDLTVIEHRLIAIFVCALLMWVLEPVPIYATSILIIVLQIVTISDASLIWFARGIDLDAALNYKNIMSSFASPVIMLFLGGFYLAAAATKYRIDINLARVLLKPFGAQPKYMMLGLMLSTALFSMFMSNTATTALMLAILTPVLKSFPPEDRGKVGFALAVPFAANIGGIGTPIGTPPNAIALQFLTGKNAVTFAQWMTFGVPFVLVNIFFCWLLIWHFYPSRKTKVEMMIKGAFIRHWKAITVYIIFAVTIFLWLTDFIHGMNSYTVALIPVAVFSLTNIITVKDMRGLNWDILWLIAGGIALGRAMEQTGLARHIVDAIQFEILPPIIVVAIAALITFMCATFMSRTATANLMLPVISALGASLPSIIPLGGSKMLILTATLAASLAMALPISTPPNAMAHGTGEITTRDMIIPGLIVGIVGLGFLALLMTVLKMVNFI